ncbi:MAG: hypothetical protein GY754_38980, partial [bacterium]|nr:hypothetical protein [bacterium]
MKNFFPVFILSFLVSIIGCGGSPDPNPDPGDPDTSSQPAIVVEINSVAINNQYSFDFGSSTFD